MTTASTLPGASAPNTIVHDTAGVNTPASDPIEAFFDGLASSVSPTGIDIGSDGFQLLTFDSSGILIDSASLIGEGGGTGDFFTLTVTGGIKHVEFSQVSNAAGVSDGSAYDNFTYELASVPAPASILLLGLGLAGFGLASKKRR
jgi:hypothetical protein